MLIHREKDKEKDKRAVHEREEMRM